MEPKSMTTAELIAETERLYTKVGAAEGRVAMGYLAPELARRLEDARTLLAPICEALDLGRIAKHMSFGAKFWESLDRVEERLGIGVAAKQALGEKV